MDIEKFNKLDIKLEYDDIIKNSCEKLSGDIRQRAEQTFKGKGDYAKNWTYKIKTDKAGDTVGIVYNAKEYQLTHLLEHGHVIANGSGRTSKRTKPHPHIKPAFDNEKNNFIKQMSSCSFKISIK